MGCNQESLRQFPWQLSGEPGLQLLEASQERAVGVGEGRGGFPRRKGQMEEPKEAPWAEGPLAFLLNLPHLLPPGHPPYALFLQS